MQAANKNAKDSEERKKLLKRMGTVEAKEAVECLGNKTFNSDTPCTLALLERMGGLVKEEANNGVAISDAGGVTMMGKM